MAEESREDLTRRGGDPALVQQVFDQLPMIVAAMQGPELRFTVANRAAYDYVSRGDFLGRTLLEILPEVAGQQWEQFWAQAWARGEPQSIREWRAQWQLPDGSGLMEVFMDFDVTPWRDAGELTGLIVTVTDVTERVRERRAAQAREAAAEQRFAQARDVVDALQRELLPRGLPVLPGLAIAASYLLADADTAAGGDWFDAFALPDGRVALVVGDVVGHGVTASATMGQLRVLLKERLTATADLAASLAALDTAAKEIRGAHATTVCAAILDPGSGELEYCTAGHPPPLIVSAGRRARFLPATGAPPLGAGSFAGLRVGGDRLTEDDVVLLHTDGILERPGRDLAGSTVELAEAVSDVAADRVFRGDSDVAADRLCVQTVELLTRITGHTDDITLLAGQRVPAPPALALTLSADDASLRTLRGRLREWLTAVRVGADDSDAVQHAVLELATNVVDHAWIDTAAAERTFAVTAALTGAGAIEVRVADHGQWREPAPSADRGLGLLLASQLVDRLTVEHDEHGTTAAVTHRAHRPARLLTTGAPRPTPAARPAADVFLVLDQPSAPGPRVRVDGPVDVTTVAEFDRAIRTAGAAGTRSLTVDLTGVTHLASAAVAALHRLRALHHENTTAVRLYAPSGTVADMIMSLVALDHDTQDPDYGRPAG